LEGSGVKGQEDEKEEVVVMVKVKEEEKEGQEGRKERKGGTQVEIRLSMISGLVMMQTLVPRKNKNYRTPAKTPEQKSEVPGEGDPQEGSRRTSLRSPWNIFWQLRRSERNRHVRKLMNFRRFWTSSLGRR
jgi:hypothetical protein